MLWNKYNFTQDWFSQFIPIWNKYLKHIKNKANKHILEIGSYEGKSTTWILDNLLTNKSSTITCIDSFQGGFEHKDMNIDMKQIEKRFFENINKSGKSKQVKVIKRLSYKALRKLKLEYFDVIYIDGSHLSKDVISDLVLSHPLLKKGGILICDDYDWEIYKDPLKKPKTSIDFFIKVFADEYTILYKKQQIFLKKNN